MEVQDIRKIGVVGCGLMGAGIIELCSRAGFEVVAREINTGCLEKGLNNVFKSMAKAVEKAKLTQEEMDGARSRITGTLNLADMADCDVVIEAAVENMALKKEIFGELDKVCKPETLLASNTSSLSITEIAAATTRPDKVLGFHFFNPVTIMQLLEVVSGLMTSAESLAFARGLGEKLGKTVVSAKDRPGFIVNLLLIPYCLDAIRWLDAGLATKEEIDTAMKLGANHPIGPIALSDLIGLDVVLFIADVLFEEFRESRYAAPPVLRRMVKAGLLGRKTKRGFYTY